MSDFGMHTWTWLNIMIFQWIYPKFNVWGEIITYSILYKAESYTNTTYLLHLRQEH